MSIHQEIQGYIASQPGPKRDDMEALHSIIVESLPNCKLWFDDGKNAENRTVSNPSIGYGLYTIKYANGTTRDFYQIGISANAAGLSVYILGIDDKSYLPKTYAKEIGKATVTGYCIKFKKLKDINIDVLKIAILNGVELTNES